MFLTQWKWLARVLGSTALILALSVGLIACSQQTQNQQSDSALSALTEEKPPAAFWSDPDTQSPAPKNKEDEESEEQNTGTVLHVQAFSEDPHLQEACEAIVQDADVCQDVVVVRGTKVDAFLRARERDTGLREIRGMAFDYTDQGIESLLNSVSDKSQEELGELARKCLGNANYLEQTFSIKRGIMVRSDVGPETSVVAHEYAHLLFERHKEQILPSFLPTEGTPIMDEKLFQDALEEEEEQDTEIWEDSLIAEAQGDPNLFTTLVPVWYFAKPTEEFAYGFQLLDFQVRHPEKNLNDFFNHDGIEDPDNHIPIATTWYFETLWERVSPLES